MEAGAATDAHEDDDSAGESALTPVSALYLFCLRLHSHFRSAAHIFGKARSFQFISDLSV